MNDLANIVIMNLFDDHGIHDDEVFDP